MIGWNATVWESVDRRFRITQTAEMYCLTDRGHVPGWSDSYSWHQTLNDAMDAAEELARRGSTV